MSEGRGYAELATAGFIFTAYGGAVRVQVEDGWGQAKKEWDDRGGMVGYNA